MNSLKTFIFKEYYSISPLLLSILINILLFSLFFLFITPGFETNDDALMMMFSSGMLTGDPSEYLVQMNILVGKLLKMLYIQNPAINWYAILLYAIHFSAMVTLLYTFLKLQRKFYSITAFTILFVFFELLFLTNIQYTSTAFIVGFCGITLFLLSLNRSLRNSLLTILVALILISIATLIRSKVFIGVLMISVPVLGIKFIEDRKIQIPIFIFCLLAIYFAAFSYENYFYEKNLGKPNLLKYEQATDYVANGPLKIDDENLNKVNWNRNDITLFQHWFWIDKGVFSKDKVIFIGNTLKTYRRIQEVGKLFFYEILFKAKRYVFLGLLCLILIFTLLAKKQLKYMMFLLITLAIVYFGLSFLSRIPHRVALPLLYFVCIIGFYFVLEYPEKKRISIFKKYYFVLMLVTLFIFQISKIAVNSEINKVNNKVFQQAVNDISKDKKSLFVTVGPDFPYESIPIFKSPLSYRPLNILPTGWPIHTPVYDKILEKFYVQDLLSSLYEKNNIYILTSGWATPAPYDKVSEQYSVSDLLASSYKKDGYIYDKSNDSFFNALKIFYKDHYKLNVKFHIDKKNFEYIKVVKVTLD